MGQNSASPANRRSRALLLAQRAFMALALAAALTAIGPGPARAQMAAPPPTASGLGGIEILATPYFWTPWVGISVSPRDPRLPGTSGTVGAGQVVDHLTWVPFMGSIEFRDGPLGALFDYIHAPLKGGITTKDIIFGSGQAGVTINTGTAMFLYRAMAAPNQAVDVGLGMRAWGLGGDILLSGKRRLLPDVNLSTGQSWADPLIGARYHVDFGNGYGATAYGDVGGFGLGAHIDWQLLGTIDYSYNSWINLHAGFRSLNFNYSAPRTGLDVHMYGPIIAATFRF